MLDVDGIATLAAMAARPDAFAAVAADAGKAAHALLAKALKARSTDLAAVRAMASALPVGTLARVTDGMTDADVSALARRLDPGDPDLAAAGRVAQAARVGELAAGAREPAPAKATRTGRPPRAAKPKATRHPAPTDVERARAVLSSKAMGARRTAA